jgi:hypothetical protein
MREHRGGGLTRRMHGGSILRGGALQRPTGIYASSLSRRDLARRRARLRPRLLARTGTWVMSGAILALAAVLGDRLVG